MENAIVYLENNAFIIEAGISVVSQIFDLACVIQEHKEIHI